MTDPPVTESPTLYRVVLRDQWTGQEYPGTLLCPQEYAERLVAAMNATSHLPNAVFLVEPVPEHEGSTAGAPEPAPQASPEHRP